MAGTNVTFNSTQYTIPFSRDLNWGEQIRAAMIDLLGNSVSTSTPTLSTLTFTPQTTTLAASANFDPNSSPGPATYWRIESTGGAVSINSIVAAESVSGTLTATKIHTIILEGTSDSNTVLIPDNSGTRMNGDFILTDGVVIAYIWDPVDLIFNEVFRNQ